jgi:hypothetical protein
MITLELTYQERIEFPNILPAWGNIEALELTDKIIQKVKINDKQDIQNDKTKKYEFDEKEIIFLRDMIQIRSDQQQLNFSSLSLIRKILNIKEK